MHYACEQTIRPTHQDLTRYEMAERLLKSSTQRLVNSNFIGIYNDLLADMEELFGNPEVRKMKRLKRSRKLR